jgi:hypothetical protein
MEGVRSQESAKFPSTTVETPLTPRLLRYQQKAPEFKCLTQRSPRSQRFGDRKVFCLFLRPLRETPKRSSQRTVSRSRNCLRVFSCFVKRLRIVI